MSNLNFPTITSSICKQGTVNCTKNIIIIIITILPQQWQQATKIMQATINAMKQIQQSWIQFFCQHSTMLLSYLHNNINTQD